MIQRTYHIPRSGLGYRIHQAAAVRRLLAGDPRRVVLATLDSVALPLLALRARRRLPNPVAYFSIGLCDHIERGMNARLARRYLALAREAAVIFVFTRHEADRFREWTPQGLVDRPGLRVTPDDDLPSLREDLWRSELTVIPVKAVRYGSGQTAAIQAMAADRGVVMTDTGWGVIHGLRDREHFVDVPPGDARALREAIEWLRALPDRGAGMARRAQTLVGEQFTPERQAAAIVEALAGVGLR